MHYHLESNQADRINFDAMIERGLEAALDALDTETANHYIQHDSYDFVNVQWDMDSLAFTDEGEEYAEDMGLTFVEDMEEAEARYHAVGLQLLKDKAAELERHPGDLGEV